MGDREEEHFKQNKVQYEAAVTLSKPIYVLILNLYEENNPLRYEQSNFQKQLGMSNIQLKKLFNKDEMEHIKYGIRCSDDMDQAFLHKVIYHLCGFEKKAPEIQNNLKIVKDVRNHISHSGNLRAFNDNRVWKEIEELKDIYQDILNRLKDVYNIHVYGGNHMHVENIREEVIDKIDQILQNFEVTVEGGGGLIFFDDALKEANKCPYKVKLDLDLPDKDGQFKACYQSIVHRLGRADTEIRFSMKKTYFKEAKPEEYDCKEALKELLPALNEECRCKLTQYRGSLSNEIISMLPECLNNLYLRMPLEQIEHLNRQLPKFLDLQNLNLYLDLAPKAIQPDSGPTKFTTMDVSAMPTLEYKGKQFGIKFEGPIDYDRIPWIVDFIKKLSQMHQLDTLEFYKTKLNTETDVEELLTALNDEEIYVTTWVKLQNETDPIDEDAEWQLDALAQRLSLRKFKFMRPW